MKQSYIETPIFRSIHHDQVFYKMDCYQPSGCFKMRGMYWAAESYQKQGAKGFISSSGGNAGFSLAHACKDLDMPLHVVVPTYAPDFMVQKIRSVGATVEQFGAVWNDAHAYALQLTEAQGDAIYIPPFDDPYVWEGNATVIDECASQMDEPDELVVAVGGGGFLCGIMMGLERNKWHSVQVIAAETEGAASFRAAQEAGEVVELAQLKSIATSLGSKKVAEEALRWAKKRPITSYVMSDKEAVSASLAFAEEYNVITEPACGAALSYVNRKEAQEGKSVLIMICGGITYNATLFEALRKKYR